MNLLSKLFNSSQKSGLKLKFSKASDQWQVFKGMTIMYVGDKEHCEKYLENFQLSF
ncbi:MAG: hypothetical protein ABJG78_20540 [Cyclobacteriaceae bacterium]